MYCPPMRLILISLFALIAAACASTAPSLSQAQCDADWDAVGFADGAEGAFRGKIDDYRAACARSGAPLTETEVAAWDDGWRDGIDEFCDGSGRLSARQRRAADAYCDGKTVVHAHPRGHPYVYGPRYSVGIGVGSRGVRGGVGVGFGVGLFNFGLGYGF